MTEDRMTEGYEDIINLPHWDPKNHQRMPMENRAAQFAPFAALTGHDEAIRETARLTDQLCQLDDETAKLLDQKVGLLIDNVALLPEIKVTYFEDDARKVGGSYREYKGSLRRVDEIEQVLIFTDGMVIPLSKVIDIRGDIFIELDYADKFTTDWNIENKD